MLPSDFFGENGREDGARLSGVPQKNRPSAYSYVTAKGQIVIPSKIRRIFGIKEGTRVRVDVDEQSHRIILTPVTRDYIQILRGKYKGRNLLTALAVGKVAERKLRK